MSVKKRIAVITATRAEYGSLCPLIRELRGYESSSFVVDLIVTGTHLSEKFGHTVDEIKKDGLRIDYEISIPVESRSELDISTNQAATLIEFTKHFLKIKYDAVIILGDRYEILSVAIAAGNTKTPVFHIAGGDTTEGALDEWIRHSVSKISYLHFTTNDESRRRVLQLGENPEHVYNTGSLSIDNILSLEKMSKEEALSSIGLDNCRYVICTYHPVTTQKEDVRNQMNAFLEVIKSHSELEFIVTKANSDCGGEIINQMLEEAEASIGNLHVFASLGNKRYLSLMANAEFVLGNSSSGIISAPALGVPTVNIGDRQKGRLRALSIIDCKEDVDSIMLAIDKAQSEEFKASLSLGRCPYGDGHAAEKIAKIVVDTVLNTDIDLKKKFFMLED